MNSIVFRGIFAIFLVVIIIANQGCEPESKPIKCSIKTYDEHLANLLNSRVDWQKYEYERIKVYYQINHEEQARLLASLMEELILHVEKRLNLQLNISELNLFLLKSKRELPTLEEKNVFSGTGFNNQDDQKALMTFFVLEKGSVESILKKNAAIPFSVFMHELVEGKLATRIKINFHPTKYDSENLVLTRWFREGLSNYANYISSMYLLSKFNIDKYENKAPYYNGLDKRPFSNLNTINQDLFKWEQKISLNNNIDYYNAATGLFLLIEDKYGVEAISEICENINELNRADGRKLIALCNDSIGEDIVGLVDRFCFPDLGIEMKALYPHNNISVPYGLYVKKVSLGSIAHKAGVEEGDVIIKVNEKAISTEFEFEYIIFKSNKPQIPIKIWRQNKGTLALVLDTK